MTPHHSHGHPHRFDPANKHVLDSAERRQALPPEATLSSIPIGPHDTVVDLGAGTGYFSIPAAAMTNETVHAVDVSTEMLEELKQRKDTAGVKNIELVQGTIENVPLDDKLADVVIASLVLHEVEPLEQGIQEIHRLLKPGGKLLCIDWEAVDSPMGPPLHVRIASDKMSAALESQGFSISARHVPAPALYTLVAQKL